jgi:parvulin-like peptidyl-prolyl isomerase
VATVGDLRLTKGDLADFVWERFREQWWQAVDEMIDERLVAAEARRLGVAVPASAVDAAVEAEAKARGEQLRARFGDGVDLAEAVRAYYGLDVETWRRTVLRPRLHAHLALERVVRLSARTREQVVARVIVTRDRARAADLRAKVEQGADFSLTALQESEDPSRSLGGVIPAIGRGDLAFPAVEEALFRAALGAVVGPLEVTVAGVTELHLYKVVDRQPPWTGGPDVLLPRLEEDLVRNPVTRAEYDRWSSRTRRAHGVRYFAPDGSVLRPEAAGR